MANYLITGGAGYIGSHTALKLLQSNNRVAIIDNLENGKKEVIESLKQNSPDPLALEFINLDLRNYDELTAALKGRQFDAVIHFAAYIEVARSVKEPQEFFQNNTVGSQNFFKALLDNKINNLIFSSSAAVYGTPQTDRLAESHQLHPESPYGTSKMLSERILEEYGKFLGFNSIALRYFNPAGSFNGIIGERHPHESHLIPKMLRAIINNQSFQAFGKDYETPDGTAIRDYIHILDIVDAHIKAAEYLKTTKGYSVFNVGTGKGSSILEVIKTVEMVSGQKLNYDFGPPREGDPPKLVADPTLINEKMGWTAQYDLTQTVQSAWEWEQKRSNADYN